MNESSPRLELAALIGIDWADQQHEIALREVGADRIETMQLSAKPEALRDWLRALRTRFGGRPVGVILEQSRGPLIHALLEHEFLALYPVNPATVKWFRRSFYGSGSKDDPRDAALLLELLEKHRDRLHPWTPDDSETRLLGRLVEGRRRAVDERTQLVQRLTAELKSYFPQALDWAGTELASPMALDFLRQWPTLSLLKGEREPALRRFYSLHNCRSKEQIERRLREIRRAVPLVTDPAIVEPSVLTVRMLVEQIRALNPVIEHYEERIAELFARHPDAPLFRSLPGAGAALAPRLLTAFGTDRSRFPSAGVLQQYCGIAPVTERSGKSRWVHWRWAAPRFLRQSFHEFAGQSIRSSVWARAYYEMLRERGKSHHSALRALAFKWLRILWRCWQDRRPYCEAEYMAALRRAGSPLAHRIPVPAS